MWNYLHIIVLSPSQSSTMNIPSIPRVAAIRAACVLLAAIGAMHTATAQEAAAVEPAAVEPAAAARDTARVRLFGQNGVLVEFYQNSSCIGGKAQKTTVSGGMGDAFSSFLGRAKNTSIGMKDTPNTTNLSKRDGMMSKAYFREYEIPGNQPMTLRMHFQSGPGTGYVCRRIGGTFTPEAGKDYEIGLSLRPGGCEAVVEEIQQDAQGAVSMKGIPVAPVVDCD